jgi:hypothetical protein
MPNLAARLSLQLQWVRDEWIGRLVIGVFDDDTPAIGRIAARPANAELEQLRKENAALRKESASGIRLKVS